MRHGLEGALHVPRSLKLPSVALHLVECTFQCGFESLLLRESAVDIQLRDRRQRPPSRNARSSWFPYTVAGVVQKAACTCETPEPTLTPSGQASRLQIGLPRASDLETARDLPRQRPPRASEAFQ
jgi:hypothetical protein